MKSVETNLDNQSTVVKESPIPHVNDEISNDNENKSVNESVNESVNNEQPEASSNENNTTPLKQNSELIETTPEEESLLDTVYSNIKQNLQGVELDLSSIMLYTARTIEFVEVFNKKSNSQLDKKNIVVTTIFKILDETTDLTDTELEFVKFMLDGIIESMIKTSTKEIKIKVPKKEKKQSKILSINQIIEELHIKCITIVKENKYDTNNILINIPVMVGMIMSLVEHYTQLNGTEKKAVIIKVVKKLMNESIPNCIQISDKDKQKIKILLNILPNMVDILIEISNNKYVINSSKSNCIELIKKTLKTILCNKQQEV